MKVLKFSASWCGPCKSLAKTIEDYYKGDVRIEEIDVDNNRELAEKYGIRGVPTCILLDDNDIEVTRKVGMMMIDEFESFLNSK